MEKINHDTFKPRSVRTSKNRRAVPETRRKYKHKSSVAMRAIFRSRQCIAGTASLMVEKQKRATITGSPPHLLLFGASGNNYILRSYAEE